METLLEKDKKRTSLSQIAVGNLTAKADSKKVEFVLPDKTDIKTENNNNIREEVKPMVTSTIVETQSANDSAFSTATDMALDNAENKSSIKDANTASKSSSQSSAKKAKDLNSGMELLEMDFLLDVVEETTGKADLDVNMRQLCFNEILRRESRHEVASAALKVYATNGPTYGKDIQCQAMLELAARTSQNNK